ncbi:MAG TPA: glycosyltransferase family 1 protein [Thiothrix sp.]|nr:glycosyltransferase family 1 protein [Thiothrix sp.]
MKKIESGNVNIVIIITKGDIGGAQIHVKDMATALQALGNTVTIIVGEKREFTELLESLDIRYHVVENLVREINPVKDFKALHDIRTLLADIKPDLVSIHSSKAGILGRIATAMNKIPTTFTAHGWAFTDGVSAKKQLIYKTIEKITSYLPARIITVSHYDRGIALKHNICKPEKLIAIQNGIPDIDPSLFADPSKSPPQLIMVARFQHPKDHQTLVEALLPLKHLPWQLSLVGDGEKALQKACEETITHLGLQEKIQLLGYRSDIDQLMANSHIFLLISNWEGFPLSILEAMRAKLPVIASRVGGVVETIRNGENGYLVNDKKELTQRLKDLITNSKKRTQLGEQARQDYLNNFTLEIQLKKTFAVYNELLTQHHH